MPKPGRYTVYVVDDDEAVRDSLETLLAVEGFDTVTFSTTEDFLTHFHPAGDACLLLDVQLPGTGGMELLDAIVGREHHLPIIMMTGNADGQLKARAIEAGAAAFLDKPLDADRLIGTIKTVLQ